MDLITIWLGNLLSAICFWILAGIFAYLLPKLMSKRFEGWIRQLAKEIIKQYYENGGKYKRRRKS